MEATGHFSTRDAARILESTEAHVRRWARLGGVAPQSQPGGRIEFTFQELLLLRTTRGLLEAGIPPRRVRRIWSSLRRQLADDRPLTSIRILANGDRAVAWDGTTPWQPDSGQFLIDFDAVDVAEHADVPAESPDATLAIPAAAAAAAPSRAPAGEAPADRAHGSALSAEQWFHLGCELDGSSPVEARQAYHQALAADPGFGDAHLNLGRLYHEARELGKAEAHYRSAVRCAPEDATCHFNLAVLLEDRGCPEEAILAYRQAIARDPDAADAHYNLGLLLEARGRRSDALKHLMTARRLYAAAGRGH
jgi:tetratricopeptide (TPR) repeat protein